MCLNWWSLLHAVPTQDYLIGESNISSCHQISGKTWLSFIFSEKVNKYWEFFFEIHENNINSVTGQPIFLLHSTFAQFEHVVKLSVDNRQLGVFDLHLGRGYKYRWLSVHFSCNHLCNHFFVISLLLWASCLFLLNVLAERLMNHDTILEVR